MAERIGRYHVFDTIAQGGMATVHLARVSGPMGFARTVAVKRLHPHYTGEGDLSVMLLDEARVTARIQHPCVVQTLDVVAEKGELMIVMEYVHGEALSRLYRRNAKPLPPPIACAILVNVLHGLHAAHEVTDDDGTPLLVVHRDVSPQNILVGEDGLARVLDFGVAKAIGRIQTTREGQVKGKIAYMSPEQLQAKPVDRRTDVFAASIVLWEMLTGRRLFGGDDTGETIGRVLSAEIESPAKQAEVSDELASVVMKGLERNPDARFATAKAMADALEKTGTIATTSRVAEWVKTLYGDELTVRRKAITEIERSDGASGKIESSNASLQTKSVAHSISVDIVSPRPSSNRRRAWIALGSSAIVGLGAFAWWTSTRPLPPTVPSADPSATSASSARVTAVPVASPPLSTAPPSSSIAASATPTPRATTIAAHTSHSLARPAASVDCSDPYTFDAQGRKRYRRECLKE